MTRFGEISSLWQKIRNIWQHLKGLFDIWQSCELTLGLFVCFWTKFHRCKWSNIKKQYCHLVTLLTLNIDEKKFRDRNDESFKDRITMGRSARILGQILYNIFVNLCYASFKAL